MQILAPVLVYCRVAERQEQDDMLVVECQGFAVLEEGQQHNVVEHQGCIGCLWAQI